MISDLSLLTSRHCDECGRPLVSYDMYCDICGRRVSSRSGFFRLRETIRFGSNNGLRRERGISDPTKIAGIFFGLGMFAIFYQIPSWLDPVLSRLVAQLGLNMESSHPWAPALRAVITVSWWLFLLLFVIVNAYQVSWAGVGYRLRKRPWQKGNPEDEIFNPSVAILVPAYNEERHVARTLKSCADQSYPNITQVILVDDGSTDRTGSIVKDCMSRDRRILYIRKERNEGKPAALNTGFSASNADLTFFMDGDSHLDSRAIERLVPHFKDPQVGCTASLISIHNNNSTLAKCQEVEYFFTQLVTRFCQSLEKTVLICPGAGTMVRTNVAKMTDHSSRTITEDADFTFEIHRRWRISQEPHAYSYTDAMTTWKSFINQRVRWLYGVLQTISLHRWSASKLWVLWAWFGYFMCPITFAILALIPLMTYVFGFGFLVFFVGYSVVAGLLAWAVHSAPILWHPKPSKKLALLVPIYLVYQQYLNFIQLRCVLAKMLKRGVTVKYGPREIHAV